MPYDIIRQDITKMKVDAIVNPTDYMFSGSGALGFEAISRGAVSAVCLDNDRRSADIIRQNAQALSYTNRCEIINCSCFDYIKRTDARFDIIFLDPPYNKGYILPAIEGIVKGRILSEDGIIVLESDGTDFHSDIDGLCIYRQRKYGRTYITIYQYGKES